MGRKPFILEEQKRIFWPNLFVFFIRLWRKWGGVRVQAPAIQLDQMDQGSENPRVLASISGIRQEREIIRKTRSGLTSGLMGT